MDAVCRRKTVGSLKVGNGWGADSTSGYSTPDAQREAVRRDCGCPGIQTTGSAKANALQLPTLGPLAQRAELVSSHSRNMAQTVPSVWDCLDTIGTSLLNSPYAISADGSRPCCTDLKSSRTPLLFEVIRCGGSSEIRAPAYGSEGQQLLRPPSNIMQS